MTRRRITGRSIRLELPDIEQRTDYTCGAAAVLAVARYYGVGPTRERQVAADMRMTLDGSDPVHLRRALARYRLSHHEQYGMTDAQLRAQLDARRPVIIMLQAWGKRRSYRGHWADGHWVVVIGHDARGVYVEDPSLARARGFVTWRELADRWHDIEGTAKRRVHRYALVVWSSRRPRRAPVMRFARALG